MRRFTKEEYLPEPEKTITERIVILKLFIPKNFGRITPLAYLFILSLFAVFIGLMFLHFFWIFAAFGGLMLLLFAGYAYFSEYPLIDRFVKL
jgi:hypothetical protein